MIRLIRRAVFSTLIFVLLVISLLGFVIATTPGLYTALTVMKLYLPGSLHLVHPRGRLLDGFSIESVQYQYQKKTISIKNLQLQWQLLALFQHQPSLITVKAKQLCLTALCLKELALTGHLEDSQHGYFDVHILPENKESLHFQGATIHAELNPQQLQGQGKIDLDANINSELAFQLPHFKIYRAFRPKQQVSAQLNMAFKSLDFIKPLNPVLSNPKGKLTATIKAQGNLFKPRIETHIDLNQASCSLPQLGLQLDAIAIHLNGNDQILNLNGLIRSGNNQLILKGQAPVKQPFSATINVTGDNFPVINTKTYQIHASPQLQLQVSPSLVTINGSILVPYAKIMLQSFTNSLTLSEDVVFVDKQHVPVNPLTTAMNIQLDLGKDIELSVKGLHANLAGSLKLKQQAHEPVTANGELQVKKGEYHAYGQDLAIDQGQLIYTGGSLTNPGINVRASKKINTETANFSGTSPYFDLSSQNLQPSTLGSSIRVGVEVTGRLTSPKIQLFANPAMLSQADILSMLVLGRPASQANKTGGQLLLAAIASMNLAGDNNGTQLIEQLKQNYGFDFDVQTSTNYNQATNQFTDSTAFVVSKSLSKRLYLSYNVGLSQSDPNVMTLKYLLSKFLSIQVSSSVSASGIDVLYTKNSKDKKP